MKTLTSRALYWSITSLFAAAMLMDGLAGILRSEAGQEVLRHLGYPIYNMPMFGIAKMLGAIALLVPGFRTIKEWAYAGFTFNFLAAFASRAIVGDAFGLLVPPLVMLAFMAVSYLLWKQMALRSAASITPLPVPHAHAETAVAQYSFQS